MSNTQRQRRQPVSAAAIAQRSALPLFLFSVVLLLFLMLSKFYLLPELTTVELAGQERNAQELKTYHATLLEQMIEKEHERDALVLPLEDTLYNRLVEMKHAQFPLLVLRSSLVQTARQLLPDSTGVVHVESMRYIPGKQRAELTGDVRNVGSRSMTVLAQLVEDLRAQPFVEDVTNPKFQRKESSQFGPYSPFTLRLKLQ